MSNLEELLCSVQAQNDATRNNAQAALQALKVAQPVEFLAQLIEVLADENARLEARQLAGISTKNMLKNSTQEEVLVDVWAKTPPEQKPAIRLKALGVLACLHRGIRSAAAQVVATIIGLDLPKGEWQDVLPILITNASNVQPEFREASIMTLGYACEEIPEGVISQDQVNKLLTPIVGVITSTEANLDIVIVAIRALRNSLKFIKLNMSNDNERSYIVNTLCSCAQHTNSDVRHESLQVLCDIAFYYYDFIANELNALGTVTFNSINVDEMRNAVMGIEFWTIIADHEKSLMDAGQAILGYISIASATLLDILLAKMPDTEEGMDDEWTLNKASGTALASIAQVIGNLVLDKVSAFIVSEIRSEQWPRREAAVLAFGMIMEGPTPDALKSLVVSGVDPLTKLMNDSHVRVRQTTSWTLSKLVEFHLRSLPESTAKSLLPKLLESLYDKPRIACHSCWSLISIIDYFEHSNFFSKDQVETILNKCLEVAYRPDAANSENNLQIAAYSVISTLIEKAPPECTPLTTQKIPIFINLLKQTAGGASADNVQSLICSALHSIFARCSTGSISDEQADEFLTTIFGIFHFRRNVIEEGLQAIGILANNMELKFQRYMKDFMPFLLWSISNTSMSVLKAGTLVVGDLARAFSDKIGEFLPSLVPAILTNLSSEAVSSDVKIQSIESLADLANHAKHYFVEYIPQTLPIIEGAASASTQVVNEQENLDMFEYLLELREAILMFYIGLISGLSECGKANLILGSIPKVLDYTMFIVQDQLSPSKNIHSNAIGLLGDIALVYKHQIKQCFTSPGIMNYLQIHYRSTEPDLMELAKYSIRQVNELSS